MVEPATPGSDADTYKGDVHFRSVGRGVGAVVLGQGLAWGAGAALALCDLGSSPGEDVTQHRGPCEDLGAVSTLGHQSEPPGSTVPWHSHSRPEAGIRQTLVLGTCAPPTCCPLCLLSFKERQEPGPLKRLAGPGLKTGRDCLRPTGGVGEWG